MPHSQNDRPVTIQLSHRLSAALREASEDQHRPLKFQAEIYIERGLRAEGYLPSDDQGESEAAAK